MQQRLQQQQQQQQQKQQAKNDYFAQSQPIATAKPLLVQRNASALPLQPPAPSAKAQELFEIGPALLASSPTSGDLQEVLGIVGDAAKLGHPAAIRKMAQSCVRPELGRYSITGAKKWMKSLAALSANGSYEYALWLMSC